MSHLVTSDLVRGRVMFTFISLYEFFMHLPHLNRNIIPEELQDQNAHETLSETLLV